MDLFEHYEKLPQIVQDIINSHGDDFTYDSCELLLSKLKDFGYTFEYGLDATPFNLRRVFDKLDFDDVVTDGDGTEWSQVCDCHADEMTKQETEHFIYRFANGTCGMKGCEVEAEHYVDFKA